MPRKAAKKKQKRTKQPVPFGAIFYVKWNMKNGTQQYFKATATGKNHTNGDFDIKYEDGFVETKKHPTHYLGSEENLLSDEQFQAKKPRETHPYKPPRVGANFQASLTKASLTTPAEVDSTSRYSRLVPLPNAAVVAGLADPFKNPEAKKDMDESGMSDQGWTGGRKKRRCSKKKIKKKMICYKGTKRKLKKLHNLTRKLQINTTLCSKKRLKKWNRPKKTRRRKRRKKKTRKKRGGVPVPKRFKIGAKWQPKVEFANRKTTLEILPWNTEEVISAFGWTEAVNDMVEEEEIENTVDFLHEQGWLLLGVQQIDTVTRQIVQSKKMLHNRWDLDITGAYQGHSEH